MGFALNIYTRSSSSRLARMVDCATWAVELLVMSWDTIDGQKKATMPCKAKKRLYSRVNYPFSGS